MRLWSLHPRYLDRRGLLAVWREGLLAQAVLLGKTKGYRRHPQLDRFRSQRFPLRAIGRYLHTLWQESARRGYRFDRSKIAQLGSPRPMTVTTGQLQFEREWLASKLARRAPERQRALAAADQLDHHPSFVVVPGGIEPWERGTHVG